MNLWVGKVEKWKLFAWQEKFILIKFNSNFSRLYKAKKLIIELAILFICLIVVPSLFSQQTYQTINLIKTPKRNCLKRPNLKKWKILRKLSHLHFLIYCSDPFPINREWMKHARQIQRTIYSIWANKSLPARQK